MYNYEPFERFERAELYRIFADIFFHEPTHEQVISLKEMFLLTFDDTIDEIRSDYYNLFYSSQGILPLESFQRRFEVPSWKLVEDVMKFYHSIGVTLDEEMDIPPDHISSELIFMSYLIENNYIREQKVFFEEHIIKWVVDFLDEIYKRAATSFFREFSQILKEFIISEHEEMTGIS